MTNAFVLNCRVSVNTIEYHPLFDHGYPFLLTTGIDGLARIWKLAFRRLEDGTLIHDGHPKMLSFYCKSKTKDMIRCAAWTLGGTRIIACGTDGLVRIFLPPEDNDLLEIGIDGFPLRPDKSNKYSADAWLSATLPNDPLRTPVRTRQSADSVVTEDNVTSGPGPLRTSRPSPLNRQRTLSSPSIANSVSSSPRLSGRSTQQNVILDVTSVPSYHDPFGIFNPSVDWTAHPVDNPTATNIKRDEKQRMERHNTRYLLDVFDDHNGYVTTLSCSNDGRIATSSWDGKCIIRKFDLAKASWQTMELLCKDVDEAKAVKVTTIFWSVNDRYLITASSDLLLRIWDAHDGRLLFQVPGHSDEVYIIIGHPFCEKLILTAGFDGLAFIWDVETGQSLWKYDYTGRRFMDGNFSYDGNYFVLTDDLGRSTLFGMPSLLAFRTALLEGRDANAFNFSSNEQFLKLDSEQIMFDAQLKIYNQHLKTPVTRGEINLTGELVDSMEIPLPVFAPVEDPLKWPEYSLMVLDREKSLDEIKGILAVEEAIISVQKKIVNRVDIARTKRRKSSGKFYGSDEEVVSTRAQIQQYLDEWDSDSSIYDERSARLPGSGEESSASNSLSGSSLLSDDAEDDDFDDELIFGSDRPFRRRGANTDQIRRSSRSARSDNEDHPVSRTSRRRRPLLLSDDEDAEVSHLINIDDTEPMSEEDASEPVVIQGKKRSKKSKKSGSEQSTVNAMELTNKYLPAAWTQADKQPHSFIGYVPQLGDRVVYLTKGHVEFVNLHIKPLLGEFPDKQYLLLTQEEVCMLERDLVVCGTINSIAYHVGPPTWIELELIPDGDQLDRSSSNPLSAVPMVIKYYDTGDQNDFLVLESVWNYVSSQHFSIGQHVNILYDVDEKYPGTIKEIKYEAHWKPLLISYDDESYPDENVNFYEIELDSNVEVPSPEALPPFIRDFAVDRIQKEIVKVSHFKPFLKQVPFDVYPDYLMMVAYPMHLHLILNRLRNNYYRSLEAVDLDFNLVAANAKTFNEPGSDLFKLGDDLLSLWQEIMYSAKKKMHKFLSSRPNPNLIISDRPKRHIRPPDRLEGRSFRSSYGHTGSSTNVRGSSEATMRIKLPSGYVPLSAEERRRREGEFHQAERDERHRRRLQRLESQFLEPSHVSPKISNTYQSSSNHKFPSPGSKSSEALDFSNKRSSTRILARQLSMDPPPVLSTVVNSKMSSARRPAPKSRFERDAATTHYRLRDHASSSKKASSSAVSLSPVVEITRSRASKSSRLSIRQDRRKANVRHSRITSDQHDDDSSDTALSPSGILEDMEDSTESSFPDDPKDDEAPETKANKTPCAFDDGSDEDARRMSTRRTSRRRIM